MKNNTPALDVLEILNENNKILIHQGEVLKKIEERIERLEKNLIKFDSALQNNEVLASWLPITEDVNKIEVRPEIKIKKIDESKSDKDTLSGIKNSLVGLIYIKYIKRHEFVRRCIIFIWQKFYPFYASLKANAFLNNHQRWRPLVKLSDHVRTSNIATHQIFEAQRVDTPSPMVFPVEDQVHLQAPHDHYVFPPVYVAELSETLVHGGTNMVFTRDEVLCHDLYDFARDYTSEELHGRHVIQPDKMRMRLLQHDTSPERMGEAATFVDACATNYAHWLTEVLPRIAAFCRLDQFAQVPIIVNDGLHRNILESLVMIAGSDREIIALPVGRAVHVERLYVTSVAGYVPFERRNSKLENHSHGLFSPKALQEIKERCNEYLKDMSMLDFPRKIYLRRNSGARKITNNIDIENIFHEKGYAVVEPEKLDFASQVALFNRAESIYGSSGAAFANLVFSEQNAKINIFIGKLEGISYWYWQNIACSKDAHVKYFMCEQVGSNLGVHSDIAVDVELVNQIN
jgi:capsular polysaccharide biosynthesis protein